MGQHYDPRLTAQLIIVCLGYAAYLDDILGVLISFRTCINYVDSSGSVSQFQVVLESGFHPPLW